MTEMNHRLNTCLKRLRLPGFQAHWGPHSGLASHEGWSHQRYLLELCEVEMAERHKRKTQRLIYESKLPKGKTIETFDRDRLPMSEQRKLELLMEGGFASGRDNVLAFGNPGSGKTHLVCALGYELIRQGKPVLFTSCVGLVQRLLEAKHDIKLNRELKRLDKYEAIIIDDIGYVQQNREEMEVLFTLLAHRYENRSVIITSNLAFSQWERIFKDPMTTAAAIDRLVHHSVILELNLPSYRLETAKNSQTGGDDS